MELAEKIIEMLLAVPEEDRESVLSDVLHNGIFCRHCGYGSRAVPNYDCQCWNDE